MFQVKRKGFSWKNIIVQDTCDTFRHKQMVKTIGCSNCLYDIIYFI